MEPLPQGPSPLDMQPPGLRPNSPFHRVSVPVREKDRDSVPVPWDSAGAELWTLKASVTGGPRAQGSPPWHCSPSKQEGCPHLRLTLTSSNTPLQASSRAH